MVVGALHLKQEALGLAVGAYCVQMKSVGWIMSMIWASTEAHPCPPLTRCVGDLQEQEQLEMVASDRPELQSNTSLMRLAQYVHLLTASRLLQLHANIRGRIILAPEASTIGNGAAATSQSNAALARVCDACGRAMPNHETSALFVEIQGRQAAHESRALWRSSSGLAGAGCPTA